KITLWLATCLISTTRQSNATTALSSTGAPVASVTHLPVWKRSARNAPVRPANTLATSSSLAPRVLTHSTRFCLSTGAFWQRRLRHTSKVGGWSDTEQTAVAVKPALPACPAVVTTWTAAPSRLIASRKIFGSTVFTGSGATTSNAPAMASAGRWAIQLIDMLPLHPKQDAVGSIHAAWPHTYAFWPTRRRDASAPGRDTCRPPDAP